MDHQRTPKSAELAAYRAALVEIFSQWPSIIEDASARHESQEVLNARILEAMSSMDVDLASLEVVDAYLAEVEDGSPIRPMRRSLLFQMLSELSQPEDP